jgi:altronate dehydratase
MIGLRVVTILMLVVVVNQPILDAVRGHPNLASVLVIGLICALGAEVGWTLWRRYGPRA